MILIQTSDRLVWELYAFEKKHVLVIKKKVLEISNLHSERKIFAIFKLSPIWLLNYI